VTTATTVEVSVALSAALTDAAEDAIVARLETDLRDLMHGLGVYRQPVVGLTAASSASMQVMVDGRSCAVPDMAVTQASAYVQGSPLIPREEVVTEGEGAALPAGDASDPERVAEMVSLVCRAALLSEPGLWVADMTLRPLLDLGISIADIPSDRGARYDGQDAIEELIAERARPSIDLFVDPAYLKGLTVDTDRSDQFPFLRDGLFVELGLPLPAFRFRLDPTLRPGGFTFGINDVRAMPRIGLSPGTILVNDTPERLHLMGVDAQATTNPSNRQPYGVTSIDYQPMLTEAGLTTWDPFGYLILAFAAAIRRHARCLVTKKVTARLIESLAQVFPALTEAAGEMIPDVIITRVLRDLLTDRLSIRNLPVILDLLLHYETDEDVRRHCDRVTYVRSGLDDAVAYKVAGSASTLVIYLLDPALEQAFRGTAEVVQARTGNDEAITAIRAALSDELSHIPPTALAPSVLTDDDARVAVRAALRPQFPEVVVLGYRDIPATSNIQPVARLGTS
jgi:hypothetical protein